MVVDKIIAGDTLDFDTSVVDSDGTQYRASDGWTMSLRLLPRASGSAIDIATTASGDDFNVAVSSSVTAGWAAGDYTAAALVSLAGERKTVYLGEVTIVADPGVATTFDLRSDARKALDAARALWYAHATNRVQVLEYEVAGRRMRFVSPDQLLKHIKALEYEVAREDRADRIAAGLGSGLKVSTRFQR